MLPNWPTPNALFQAIGGWNALSYQVNEVMSPNDPLTALVVNLTGVDPDDAFSTVPYEKGSAFLWYLEDTGQGQNIMG